MLNHEMKNYFLIYLVVVSFNLLYGQSSFDGVYIGLDEMCWTDSLGHKDCYSDPSRPKYKWYHLTTLKIKGDSVFVDQNPISIFKEDTLHSASDGAFYYYTGIITNKTDSIFTIDLTELFCDYCGELMQKQNDGTYKRILRKKQLKVMISSSEILINNYAFKKIDRFKRLISESSPK